MPNRLTCGNDRSASVIDDWRATGRQASVSTRHVGHFQNTKTKMHGSRRLMVAKDRCDSATIRVVSASIRGSKTRTALNGKSMSASH